MGKATVDWKCVIAGGGSTEQQLAVGAGLVASNANGTDACRTRCACYWNRVASDVSGLTVRDTGSFQSQSVAGPVPFDDRIPGVNRDRGRSEHNSADLCGSTLRQHWT